jgi:hypothetical protein
MRFSLFGFAFFLSHGAGPFQPRDNPVPCRSWVVSPEEVCYATPSFYDIAFMSFSRSNTVEILKYKDRRSMT